MIDILKTVFSPQKKALVYYKNIFETSKLTL